MIKMFENFNNYNQVKDWLDNMDIDNYTINEDLTVDVDDNVYLLERDLYEIPINFNKVNGSFSISDNYLSSLKGCPKVVNGDFFCSNNKLTSLEYSPEIVNGSFICSRNKLTSLKYSPNFIKDNFWCDANDLTNLKYCPNKIGGTFNCTYNQLTTLKYYPKETGFNGIIELSDLPYELKVYMLKKDFNLFLKYQDEYGVWDSDGSFNRERFDIFLKDYNDGMLS